MFEIGFMELVVVCVVTLLVFGPEKLPQVVRKAGLWLGRARAVLNNFKYEMERQALNEEMKEKFREQLKEIGLDENVLSDTAKPTDDPTDTAEPASLPDKKDE